MIRIFLILLPCSLAGCADRHCFLTAPDSQPISRGSDPGSATSAYRLGCADVVEVSFVGRPDWDCAASIGLDGRLPLGEAGNPYVAGRTIEDARIAASETSGITMERIRMRLLAPRAARVYVSGPENRTIRAVAYVGPEPVVAFLARVGAIKPNCSDLHDIHVVRPNVANGGRAEIYHVDIEAVVLDGDHTSNIVVQPSDHIYVGETRRSKFSRLLPPWLRPTYRRLVGLLPNNDNKPGQEMRLE